MDIKRRVFANLSRFKDCLASFPPGDTREREYRVLLDLESGEMRFSEKIHSLRYGSRSSSALKNPKQVRLLVIDEEDGGARFEIHGTEVLDPDGVVKETLAVLNEMARKISGVALDRLPERTVLENLSSVHGQIFRREVENLPGWQGDLTIEEAEKQLEGQESGTYLIRNGSEVAFMTNQMKEHYGYEVHPYSLVFLNEEGKISEVLFLGIPQGWILYGDEPDLRQYPVFEDPLELLKMLGLKER